MPKSHPARDDQPLDQRTPIHPREAAFLAYARYLKEGIFLSEASPIAFGACKHARTLDYIALHAATQKKLSLKVREKALLRAALYEFYFMHTPRWVVGQEWGQLAKKYAHSTFAGFLNALIRQLPDTLPPFPTLGIQYSYPDALVAKLQQDYSPDIVEKVLALGNNPAKTFARKRPGFEMIEVVPEEVGTIALDKDYYIMNPTPAHLIAHLAAKIRPPATILDLCSAPGGKLLAAHDLFPHAELFANDVSSHKLQRLQENIAKYKLNVHLTQHLGQEYPEGRLFDLIILDIPCSNSGVFAKHPEARFREQDLLPLQKALLDKATRLCAPGGHIFFLSCSILKEERPGGSLLFEEQLLPDERGWDGGYGALLCG